MAAALRTLAQIAEPGQRKVAVLGAMSELGAYAGEEHDRVGLLAVRLRDSSASSSSAATRAGCTSPPSRGLVGRRGGFETADEAFDYLLGELRDGDRVAGKVLKLGGPAASGRSSGRIVSVHPLRPRRLPRLHPLPHAAVHPAVREARLDRSSARRRTPTTPASTPSAARPRWAGWSSSSARSSATSSAPYRRRAPTISGLLVIWMMVGFGVVGFIDDFMKVQQRSLGLSGWRKIVGQVLVAVPSASWH